MITKDERLQLEALFRLIEQSDINTFELQKESMSLYFQKKPSDTNVAIQREERLIQETVPHVKEETNVPATPELSIQQTLQPEREELHTITAPMIGTFYKRANPQNEPFVQVGDAVHKGQTICILEAMKLLNEVQSDVDGVIEEICVEEGEIIEFDQPLFRIKQVDAHD